MAARKLTPVNVNEVDDEADEVESVDLDADAELTAEPVDETAPPEALPVPLAKDYCWCGEEAVMTTDGKTANAVSFCRKHVPYNLRGRR